MRLRQVSRRTTTLRSSRVLAATLLVGILASVGCSRGRRTAAGGSSSSSGPMPDMPSMSGMPGMKGGAREDSGKAAAVELSPAQQREFGVTFGTVERRPLADELRAVGTVTIDERRVAQLAPKFSGFAERLYVDAAGAPVRRGQRMVEIYSPDVIAAEQELLSAATLGRTLEVPSVPGVPVGSADLVGAARQRLRFWDVPDAEIEEVVRTGKPRRTVTLVAPVNGVVTEKNVVSGQSVAMGQPLYTISDLSEVWVIADVREADAGRLHVNSGAQVRLESMPGRMWTGRVAYIYPTLDVQNRTVRARIAIANSEGDLKPGMFATVQMSSPSRQALTVPASAIVRTGQRALVFVERSAGQVAPREINVGRTVGDFTEVLSGVSSGDRVVTSAQFLISSESNLAEVMRGMMAQMGMSDRPATSDMKNMPGMSEPRGAGDSAALTDKAADMRNMKGMPMPDARPSPPKEPVSPPEPKP